MNQDTTPPSRSIRSRLLRGAGAGVLLVAAMVVSGLVFNEDLAPKATGAASYTLPLHPVQTGIDRELAPILAAHPGQTGTLLLADGLDAFAARAMSARKAGRSLDLQYYIWNDDLAGRLLAREVHAAAERGVRVRMLLDDLTAEGLDPQWMALDAHPLIELRQYNPFRNREGVDRGIELVQRIFSINHRMHNKAWIADGRVAVIGGRNIGEEYFAADDAVNFHDLDLLLFGPAVSQASTIFDDFWNSSAAVPIAAINRATPNQLTSFLSTVEDIALEARAEPYLARVAASGTVRGYLQGALQPHWTDRLDVLSDPPLKASDDDRGDWLVTRLSAVVRGSRHRALLVSPYFVPGEELTRGFGDMVDAGVAVGIVTNSLAANDVPAVHSGYAGYREPLLRGGVHLYEMKSRGLHDMAGVLGSSSASLHTKAFVLDDRYGFVGSFNLDPRSANLNTEMGVLFDDPALAAGVRDEYLRLTSPQVSYWLYLDRHGKLRWLDRASPPPRMLTTEPEASLPRRVLARVLSWLPIESQL